MGLNMYDCPMQPAEHLKWVRCIMNRPSCSLKTYLPVTTHVGFIVTPHSQNMTELVLAAGEEAVFECQYCVAEDISWIINGENLDELNLPENITIVRHYDIRPYCGPLHTLIMNTNVPSYNLSTIQCGPGGDSSGEVSEVITLLIQGIFIIVLCM